MLLSEAKKILKENGFRLLENEKSKMITEHRWNMLNYAKDTVVEDEDLDYLNHKIYALKNEIPSKLFGRYVINVNGPFQNGIIAELFRAGLIDQWKNEVISEDELLAEAKMLLYKKCKSSPKSIYDYIDEIRQNQPTEKEADEAEDAFYDLMRDVYEFNPYEYDFADWSEKPTYNELVNDEKFGPTDKFYT